MSDPLWGTEGSTPDSSGVEPPASPPRSPEPRPEPAPAVETPAADAPPVEKRRREPEPVPDWLKSDHGPDPDDPKDRDPVAVVAVTCGFVGIVLAGLLFAVVTAVLGAWAGQRARESGRTYELPFLAIGLAFVDGVVFLVMHLLLEVPQWLG